MIRHASRFSVMIVIAAAIAMFHTSAHAAIVYLDADEGTSGNTFATGGSLGDTSWLTGSNWEKRVGTSSGNELGNGGGDSYQGVDSEPELTTLISGLGDGTYDVWVFFWDAGNGNDVWTIRAGLDNSSELPLYSHDGAGDTASTVAASTLNFQSSLIFAAGNRALYGVNLGQAIVSGGTDIEVFVDSRGEGGNNNRTWYDGVGYELVSGGGPQIPEPASLAMGLVGLGGLLISRRRGC